MPTYSYTKSAFVPFTKIVSSDVNQFFTDILGFVNWAGSTSATTGLNDNNVQSNTASGGGLTRSTKLKAGTANYVVINDASGLMTEEAQLAITRGGTGLNITVGSQTSGDVIQVNSTSSALTIGAPTGIPASLRQYQFFHY